jgi:hypothetical protein
MLIGLVLLGLVLGWILRSKVPRARLGSVVAAAFVPAVVHALFTVWWAGAVGLDWPPLLVYGAAVAVLLALAFVWTTRTARERPLLAALGVPGHALVQSLLTSLLGRLTLAVGAVLDPLPGLLLLGIAVSFGAALLVLLPTREQLGFRTPRWWSALGRIGRRER